MKIKTNGRIFEKKCDCPFYDDKVSGFNSSVNYDDDKGNFKGVYCSICDKEYIEVKE